MSDSDNISSIAGVLAVLFKEKDWLRRLGLHAVFLFWDELVGKSVAAHARPNLIRGRVLWVGVSDSVWMQQLHLQKMIFLEKINERLAGETLEDIRFEMAIGGVMPIEPEQEIKRTKRPPDKKALKEFEKILESLEDKSTRDLLRQMWIMAHS
ncbi:MAG: hypothetical protein A2511_13215 [Deltaproteobacteria bacterium RIFOXYD12_FULL_50_9]|nr:MAG: hypothetical protein A2511_13215 [Deltaproteobacteria bacterium RIFOXYD12_FULL_50_9]